MKNMMFGILAILCCLSARISWAEDLKVGDPAPEFSTTDDAAMSVSLKDFRGKTVILYFYPKDGTPGCTKEAENFRDHIKEFEGKNAVILGVSFDSQSAHKGFKDKLKLPFRLLVDPDKSIAKAYGVSGMMFASRDTFVIDGNGKLLKVLRSVDPATHAQDLLKEIGAMK
jgi:peroxiredoxin Q/BCP